ncbi:tRNA 2-thiouridine(34) synthase MnmA [Anoxynatronum buryatiense]|uniref:tRNA-specific 2-thiouridylase MnmA n=1 Tax=Anoxynatronum buryatiense TaxID=489973 RepID=A0AA45WUP2_9CLOT|nr:tRNA 2-thiouridine(34) synthase MnmA [Anoxynatronum buryatiense]SMP49046.1 tRNA (5-methylaminomethyl-2-thiouridylate)-methyltransferase [Anoxynatronum buryatiense]
MKITNQKKVLLGMSGGVDSSVAAYVLKEQGYDVIGVTMQIWQDEKVEENTPESSCCSLSAVEDARRVANHLDIPFYVMNFKDYFRETVIDYFVKEYRAGRTPNPCIACNRYVKFEELLRRALQLGCDYVATGHYAIIEQDSHTGRYLLKKSVTDKKDQTYALYQMTQEQLQRTLMPLGNYHKEEVRRIAQELNLPVASKPESQEICFVPDNQYGKFIEAYDGQITETGLFKDQNGHTVGTHKGIIHYTVGQRKGLGLAMGKPVYVTDILPAEKEVHIGNLENLMARGLLAEDLNFIPWDTLPINHPVTIKIRYNASPVPGVANITNSGKLEVIFNEPQKAISPGQSVVLYDGDTVIGGGIIQSRIR